MTVSINRSPRRRQRLRALVLVSAAAVACAVALPSSAAAYTQDFCQNTYLGSGSNCYAGSAHTLQSVFGVAVNSYQRVCAASFVSPGGTQNSDWRCDYGTTSKALGGRVDGYGALHNGDPLAFTAFGTQAY